MTQRGAGGGEGNGVLWTLFVYEIRMLLRDRRTLMIAVGGPLLLFPVLIFAMRAVERRETRRLEEATYVYAVSGTLEREARTWVGDALALAERERDTAAAAIRFEERAAADPDSLLQAGELQLVVRALTPEEWDTIEAEAERAIEERRAALGSRDEAGEDAEAAVEEVVEEESQEAPEPRVPVLRLLYRTDSDLSRNAAARLSDALADLRLERRARLYRERGLPVDPDQVASVSDENLASAEREGGAMLGLALTPLLLFLMLSGGSIVAADAIAGEKERGTLETLLTTAARHSEIVRAKMLSIIVVGLAVALVTILNMLVYLIFGVIDLPEGFAVSVSPLALLVILVLFLPLTVLVASALLLLSGFAKSYKEYQIYFFPLFWIFLVPSVAAVLPGMALRSAIAFLPVANVGVAVREIMVGEYDWPFLLVTLASTSLAAWWLATVTAGTLSTERLISQADLDEADLVGGPALFPRHVLRWFGVLWVLLLLISLWFGDGMDIRGQVAVNLVGIFLGGTVLMLWRYRLPLRETLSLRPVAPAVWLAVVIGAPSALLTGNGVAQLAEYVFPVPDRMLEAFGQYLLPDELPLWQIVFFLAILPGICEELAFRGVLLHGLRKRLRPVPLVLAVGAIFGFFHVSLFRIIPTAYVGVLLTTVTVLTGSIFPAMLWHALNNATALVPARLGWVGEELAVEPWMYAVAAAGLALAFWILWRERVPWNGRRERPRPGETATRMAGGAGGTAGARS